MLPLQLCLCLKVESAAVFGVSMLILQLPSVPTEYVQPPARVCAYMLTLQPLSLSIC
jgi:hypothetical protein